MKLLLHTVLLVFVLIFIPGCYYSAINGKVVASVTGKPIEGALVVAQWSKKRGFGLTYHDHYKTIETRTNKEGMFSLGGVYDPFVEPPVMVIYKEGYIPWRNEYEFPSMDKVKDNVWKNNVTYRVEILNDKCTHDKIYTFMTGGLTNIGNAQILNSITNEFTESKFNEIMDRQKTK